MIGIKHLFTSQNFFWDTPYISPRKLLVLILFLGACENPFWKKAPLSPKETPSLEKKEGPTSSPKLVNYEFDYKGPYSNGLAPVRSKGKWGFIDSDEQLLIPFIFDWVNPFREGLAAIELDGKWGYVNKKGIVIVSAAYEWADNFYKGRAIVQKDGKEGAINTQGKIIIPFQYDYIARFTDTISIIKNYYRDTLLSKKDSPRLEKWGLIKHSGQEIFSPRYQHIEDFQRGYARVMRIRKAEKQYRKTFGLIDLQGKLSIPLDFQFLGKPGIYKRIQACLDSTGLWGYLDLKGKAQSAFTYELCYAFQENRGRVKKGGVFGYVDSLGIEVIPPQYPFAQDFKGGTALVAQNGLYGLIDQKGKHIVEPKYQEIRRLTHSFFHAREHQRWVSFLCNQNGDFLIKPGTYDSLYLVQEPFIGVSDLDGNRMGMYNQEEENMVIPVIYDKLFPFERGLALAQKNGQWGAYDKQGDIAVPFQYESLRYQAKNGILLAEENNIQSFMLIGNLGEVLVPFGKYEKIFPFQEGIARVYRQGLFGFIDEKGEELTPLVYNDAQDFAQGKASIRVKSRLGYLDTRGKEHWEK